MVSAVLVLLVAGMGVGFGWQPMPDGTPAYEYVVQVEPEMLETLAEGQTIPIVSDVPPGLGPIARVRVVVGRGDVPRRRMVTQLKPTTEGAATSGVVLTQYTEQGGSRYGAQPPAAAPPYGAPPSGIPTSGDPYTQAAPAAGGTWNGGDAAAANPLRTQAGGAPNVAPDGTWNPGVTVPQVADSSAAGPLQRVGAGIQDATAPIADGFDRFGNRVRTATDNLGDRTGRLLDDLGHPLRTLGLRDGAAPPAGATTAAATTTAQPGAPYDPNATSAPMWNPGAEPYRPAGSTTTTAAGGAAPPAAPWNGGASPSDTASQGGNWNQADAAPNPGAVGTIGGPPAGADAPPLIPGGPQFPAAGGPFGASGAPPAGSAANADPWSNANDARLRTGGAGGVAAGGGSQWPGTGAGASGAVGAGQGGSAMGGGAATPRTAIGIPRIGSEMLELPGNRALDGPVIPVAGTGSGNVFSPGTTAASVFPGSPGSVAPPTTTGGGLLASQGWAAGAATPPTTLVGGQSPPATPASDARNKAAVIMAWVLLSGSAAGNIYLFWSYLDVRTKYRALVRKTARAVGSRFSPA